MWKCPSCELALYQSDTGWQCDNGHRFDRAKEGYVNLLLAQHKRSKTPGDSKAMINARRGFLDAGFYAPLVNRLAELIDEHLSPQADALFDAGCGEGYYLNRVAETLTASGRIMDFSGVDIAKVAMQKAAKRYAQYRFAVASTFNLPLADSSQDGVMQVFAPASEDEVLRVLKPGGVWIQVNPAQQHLQEIKSQVYQQNTGYRDVMLAVQGAQVLHRETLTFECDLNGDAERENLLMMTPFYWSTTEEVQQSLIKTLERVTASFDIQVVQKDA